MKEFRIAKRRVDVSAGESVRIIRELLDLSQNQLTELSGIPQSTFSAIENARRNRKEGPKSLCTARVWSCLQG